MPSYTFAELQDFVVDPYVIPVAAERVRIFNVINRAVRMVGNDVDLRSSQRTAQITPNIFDDIYTYTAPTDLKDNAIIDIYPQVNRSVSDRPILTTPAVFDRKKATGKKYITVFDDSFQRRLKVNLDVDDTKLQISSLDTTTAPSGTWSALADATALAADSNRFVEGAGSLGFDLTGSAATAGIQNSTFTDVDVTYHVAYGVAISNAYINQTANITQFVLELGNDASNFYYMVATAQSDGNAFRNGWNQLRFNFVDKTETGNVTDTEVDFCRLYMVKTAAKSDDGYNFDDITLHTGEIHHILYVSKFRWQTSTGTYIEDATVTTDVVVADTDEIDLFVFRGKMELARELRDYNEYTLAEKSYKEALTRYKRSNPSTRAKVEATY